MDRQQASSERWVSVEEVAAHLGVGKESVYRWVESRGLPAHRVGRLFRFRLSEIDAWVAGRSVDRIAEARERRADRVAEPRATYAAPKWPVEPEEIEAVIDEMVRIIVAEFDPEMVVLFGSHARGDAGPDSDVDLLVVMPVAGSKSELEIDIGVALHDIVIPKDVVVATPEEVARYADVVGTIVHFALLDGKTIYERIV